MWRTSTTEIKRFSQIHYFAKLGELRDGASASESYRAGWDMVRADSFDPIRL